MISFRNKTSLLAESFRTTLTSILFSRRTGDRPRVLLSQEPALSQLTTAYAERVIKAGHGSDAPGMEYGWATLGDAVRFLKEGDAPVLQMYGGQIVGVDLPAATELTVTQTEPGVQGDRVSGARKPATLETGLVVQVPLFVNPGDRVKVDTRTGEYLTRA